MSTDIAVQEKKSLVSKFAEKYSIEATKLLETLKKTAFKGSVEISNEQMAALLVVADQYGLNPFVKEIYAFPDKGGIVPVVGVDGWTRIANEHPMFDGLDFVYSDEKMKPDPGAAECHAYVEVRLFRKDRSHPIVVREYLDECYRATGPWKSHPKRMLRHKALVQCLRVGFGFSGIYDQDEAERIIEVTPQGVTSVVQKRPQPAVQPTAPSGEKSVKQLIDKATKDGDWQFAYRWIDARLAGEPRASAKAAIDKARGLEEVAEAEFEEISEPDLFSESAESFI